MAAAAVSSINPRQDFPAWLAAHGVSLSVAEAVDRELGIGDYEAFLACAEQPHVRAEMFAAARERLPFAFYAVLRRVTEASSPKRHDGAGGGLQAAGNTAAFQPFLSGLLDAIVLMLNSLSQELLHSAERFSCLEPALYPRTERDSRMYMDDEGMSEGYSAEEAAQSAAQTSAGLNEEVDGQQTDTWEENDDIGEGELIGPDGRVAPDGVASHSHAQADLQEDSEAQSSSAWGLGTVKAEQATEAEVKTPVLDEDGVDPSHVWKDIKVEKREKYCHGAESTPAGDDGEAAEMMHCADTEGDPTQNEWGLPADSKGPHGAEACYQRPKYHSNSLNFDRSQNYHEDHRGEWREDPEEGLYPVDTNVVPHQRPPKHSLQLFGDWRGHDSRAWVHGKQAAVVAAAATESPGAARSSFEHQRTVVTACRNVDSFNTRADNAEKLKHPLLPSEKAFVENVVGPESWRWNALGDARANSGEGSKRGVETAATAATAAPGFPPAPPTEDGLNAPFRCDHCGRLFMHKRSLRIHVRNHTGERPYACDFCDQRFLRSDNLTRHRRIHTGERPFGCERCGKRFSCSHHLTQHRRSFQHYCQWNALWESSPAQANVGCPLPSADSDHTAYQGAIPHIERCVQHIPGPAAGGEAVRMHSAVARTKSRRYGSARARASAAAYAVIAAATGGTMTAPFTCTLCGQMFGKKYALLSHQRKHTGEKPYECSQCGKRFRVSNNLARHKRSHTGERPFACEQCGKRFVTSDSLGYHQQLHISKRLLHGAAL